MEERKRKGKIKTQQLAVKMQARYESGQRYLRDVRRNVREHSSVQQWSAIDKQAAFNNTALEAVGQRVQQRRLTSTRTGIWSGLGIKSKVALGVRPFFARGVQVRQNISRVTNLPMMERTRPGWAAPPSPRRIFFGGLFFSTATS